ncbi:MAG: hypothetical protein ACO39G_02170 [Flavobacteriaceae bacterium]
MTEKIKFALVQWAKKVLDQHEEWDDATTHHELQKLYELSVVQKTLLQWESENQNLWKNQQRQLDEVLENLTGTPLKQSVQEENIEVAPVMETIKNMIMEMPEQETYDQLFEAVEKPPTFVVKPEDQEVKPPTPSSSINQERPNLNDHFAKTISIDLNDRLSFIKHLFEGDSKNYERVLEQVITFESWAEVASFIKRQVQPEYQNWNGKDEFVERFITVLQKNFEQKPGES